MYVILLIITFFEIFRSLNTITIPCNETYLAKNGRFCYPCQPGFRKFSDCVNDNVTARCTTCGTGEYQPNCDNSTECIKCRTHCPSRQEKVEGCSRTSDIKCQCKPGTFWQPETGKPDEGYCKLHSSCKAGEGVLEKGSQFNDTKCVQCQEGVNYSDKESFDSCTSCSECNKTLHQRCSRTNDTVCDDQRYIPSTTEKSQSGLGVDAIVGIVLAVVIPSILVTLAIYLYRRGKSQRQYKDKKVVESNGLVNLPERSEGGKNGSKQLCKQNETELYDKHPQEVQFPKHTVQSVSKNEFVPDNINGYLGSHDNQQNLEQRNQKILESSKEVSKNGVTNPRTSVDQSFEQVVRNETHFGAVSIVYENGESNDVISTDADAVEPRHFQEIDRNDDDANQTGMEPECKDETYNRLFTSPTDNNNVDTALPARPESCVQTIAGPGIDNIRNEQQPQLTEDKVWMEVVDFLGCHLSWLNFLTFFRWLVELTASDNDFSRNKDVVIENAYDEHGRNCRERIYQLLKLWRQRTPKSTPRDIVKALERVQMTQISVLFTEYMNSKGVNVVSDKNVQTLKRNGQDGNISTQASMQVIDMKPENCEGDNHEMMELKEQIE